MGCGCTHGRATMFKVPSGAGTDCAGGFGAGASWALDVPANASRIARAIPATIRKRVSVFTVEHEAYHCFLLPSLVQVDVSPPYLPAGSPPHQAARTDAQRPAASGRATSGAWRTAALVPLAHILFTRSEHR